METDILSSRPSIRIEIQNDIKESMEVDENDSPQVDETLEDGEVSEQDENDNKNVATDTKSETDAKAAAQFRLYQTKWKNQDGGFLTGIDIFSKEEQEKLTERAKRFGINPDESKAMTDLQLQELHESLGINKDIERNVRFDAVHIRGVDEMSTKDVFGYFNAYGPAYIEWINDFSCNVVWLDNVSAARALHGISKRIRGMEFLDETNPFAEDAMRVDETNSDTNSNPVLKRQPGRSILLIDESQSELSEPEDTSDRNEEFVNASEIAIPIPPGYWRYGMPHPKAKSILLRFALRTDRKPSKAEKLSDYYKKYGNPNFGGLRGIITESRKRKLKAYVDLDKKLEEEEEAFLSQVMPDNKNPWGNLAKNWNNEDRSVMNSRIQARIEEIDLFEPAVAPIPVAKPVRTSVRDRIGAKRPIAAALPESPDGSEESSNSDSEWTKRSKVPRMRMYADEEQDRMKKLNAVKKLARIESVVDPRPKYEMQSSRSALQYDDAERIHVKQEPQEKVADLRSRLGRHMLNTDIVEECSRQNRLQGRLGGRVVVENDRVREPTPNDRHKSSNRRYESRDDDVEREIRGSSSSKSRQRSMVKVVVRKPTRPTVASTVWSRVDRSKGKFSDEDDDDRGENRRRHDDVRSRISERENIRPYRTAERDTKLKIVYEKEKVAESRPSRLKNPTRQNIRTAVKKEESESSDSDTDSESENDSSSSSSDSNSSEEEKTKHESPLKKVLSLRDTFNKGTDLKNKLSAAKDNLRIEVHNDCYRKEKSE